jgi:molecular chaperone DnaK (HSP70)
MEIIVPRNTKIPFIKTINLKLINNSSFICKIYEGERKLVKYNKLLGECKLDKISQKKKEIEIEINFEMDINKCLFIIKIIFYMMNS